MTPTELIACIELMSDDERGHLVAILMARTPRADSQPSLSAYRMYQQAIARMTDEDRKMCLC